MQTPSTTTTSVPELRAPVEIYLNSDNSIQVGDGYHNDCNYVFSRTISAPEGQALYLSVLSFTIPVSWYVVNSYNNVLVLNDLRYEVRPGNYSAQQLAAAVRALIPAAVGCAFDSITLKMSFTSANPFTLDGSLCGPLGIVPGAGTSLESLHSVDLSGVNSIYVLTEYVSHNIDTRPGDAGTVMARIPVDAPPLGVVTYLDQNGSIGRPGVLLQDGVLASIRVRLEDEYRRPLQASIFWEATLQCSFVPSGRAALHVERPVSLAVDVNNMFPVSKGA